MAATNERRVTKTVYTYALELTDVWKVFTSDTVIIVGVKLPP